MRVEKSVLAVVVAVAGLAGTAEAQGFGFGSGGRTYASVLAGAGESSGEFTLTAPFEMSGENDDDRGMFAAAAIGRDLGAYRFELEFSTRRNEGETGATSPCPGCDHAVTVHALMVNGLLDYQIGDSPVTLSAGLGLGVAGVMHDVMGEEATDSFTPAAQGILQASYAVSERVEIFGDVRYFKTLNEAAVSNSLEFSAYESQTVGLGVRFSF